MKTQRQTCLFSKTLQKIRSRGLRTKRDLLIKRSKFACQKDSPQMGDAIKFGFEMLFRRLQE